jgi:hypothetical protein
MFSPQQWLETNFAGNPLVSHTGVLNADLITSLVENTEKTISELYPENSKLIKTAVHVAVEALQNIFHHSADTEAGISKYCLFSIFNENNQLVILAGNYLIADKLQIVKDRIDQINALSRDELKTLYKLILNNQDFSEKGGGGLGLIDIARKTGTPLEYFFVELNENLYFYVLKISIV